MEATFVVRKEEDQVQFADRLTKFFADKSIRVRVEEVDTKEISQQQLLKRMEALRLLTEQVPVVLPRVKDGSLE